MAFKVFYAWQSDRPNNLCRGLIRRALDNAAKKLNAALEIEDANRQVEIDQDTQDVSGSPSIAETILNKIRTCDAFIVDLTLIPSGEGYRASPNPNVLIEYGYALHALGDQRIIGVFNNAFGSLDDLPFDLRHKKWPIRYHTGDDGDSDEAKEQRREARDGLAATFVDAIGAVMRTYAEVKEPEPYPKEPAPAAEPQLPIEPSVVAAVRSLADLVPPGMSRTAWQYPWDKGLVGVREGWARDEVGYEVHLLAGPTIFLQLKPRNHGAQLSNVATMRIVRESLRPLAGHRTDEWSCVRNRHGGAAFTSYPDDPGTTDLASLLVRNGEIHGIDCRHLQVHRYRIEAEERYIPTGAVEEILIDGLANYLKVAKEHLGLPLPFEVVAGLEGVEEYRLAVNPDHFAFAKYAGHIFQDSIGRTFTIDSYECDPFEVLLPLFTEIYDAAGEERPDVRTVGRSQR